MPGVAFVRGESVGLYTVEREDLDAIQRWHNDPAIRYGLTRYDPRNDHQIEEWFEEHVSDTDDGAQFVICPLSGDRDDTDSEAAAGDGAAGEDDEDDGREPVGFVSLFDVEQPSGNGELACLVAPEHRGQGYATAATRLLVTHALDERRLHKVKAGAVRENEASRAALEELGFVREETRREERYVDGAYRDVVRYSVLADEWDGEQGPGGRAEEV